MVEPRPSNIPPKSARLKFTERTKGGLLMLVGLLFLLLPHFWNIPDPYGDSRNVAVVSGMSCLVLGGVLALRPVGNARRMSRAASGVLMSGFGVLLIGIAIGLRALHSPQSLLFSCALVGIVVLAVGIVRSLNLGT